jgi:hypothetical protein
MLLRFNKRSGAGALILASTTLAVLPTFSATAQARVKSPIAVVAPSAHVVSGSIPFAARGITRNVKKVVFKIDGHRAWTTGRRPFRFRRTGRLNTRTLRNGTHVLLVEAIYRNRAIKTAHARIVVRNLPVATTARKKKTPAPPTNPSPGTGVGIIAPPPLGVPGASPIAFNRETYNYSSSFSTTQEANGYQVMVLQSTSANMVPALHAANPKLIILMYQHPWFARSTDPNAMSVCTSYQNDIVNHPSWFLRDQNGNVIKTNPIDYVMDIGNPAYQQACVASATKLAKQDGFDGIFWDGIVATDTWSLPSGTSVPEYPSAASWQNATTSFLSYSTPALHAQGLTAFGNLCGTTLTSGLWQRWAALVDGAEEESWTDGGLGLAQQNSAWTTKLANAAWSAANGKYVLLHSYNNTETGNSFGLASMMLVANGQMSYSTSNANYTSAETIYPEYAVAAALGAPAGPDTKLSNGVYERAFSHGVVLVNPSTQSSPSFSLGGTYSAPSSGVNHASAVSMAPDSGLILSVG